MLNKNYNSIIYSIEQIDNIVNLLYSFLDKCKIFCFSGDLGAGKTTLIKNLLLKIGIKENIVSPTYLYLVNYNNKHNNYYHFDLYRLNNYNEFKDMGFYELLWQESSWSFIEWPEIIMPIIKNDKYKICYIFIEYIDTNRRKLLYEIK